MKKGAKKSANKGPIIISAILLVALIAGLFFFFSNSPQSNLSNQQPSSNTPSNSESGPKTISVSIANYAFSPSTLTINQGDTVIWTNSDSVTHTVTSDYGSAISSKGLNSGETYSHTFLKNGTFPYHCSFHPTMKATIIVQ